MSPASATFSRIAAAARSAINRATLSLASARSSFKQLTISSVPAILMTASLFRIAKLSAYIATPVGVSTAARYWRSFQRLDNHDLSWPDDSCVESFDEAMDLAERAGVFPNGEIDVDAIRQWHQERGYLGGVVVRCLSGINCQKKLSRHLRRNVAREAEDYSHAAETTTSPESDSLCYYLYYELSGEGEFEQQIFIRGTSNTSDVAIDLETTKAWDAEVGCYFHAGFLRRTERVLDDIGPLLKTSAVITLSGHSLGGAVASIMGLKLQKRGFNVRRVVTFGAPKFTTAEAVDLSHQLPLLRICHEEDVVVSLPPASVGEVATASWQGVYHHVGPQLLLGSVVGEACFIASEAAFQWWHHCLLFQLGPDMLANHRIAAYIERLQELCDGRAKLVLFNDCSTRRLSC